MREIILDTNFLMVPFQLRVDIFSEIERICNFNYKLAVLEGTIKELENMAKSASGKDKKAAKAALKIVQSKKVEIIKYGEDYVDDAILSASDKDTIVATQDMALKRKLVQKGIPIIILRQKKYLQLLERKPL